MNTRQQRTFGSLCVLVFFAILLLACDLGSLGGGATKPTVVITAPPRRASRPARKSPCNPLRPTRAVSRASNCG